MHSILEVGKLFNNLSIFYISVYVVYTVGFIQYTFTSLFFVLTVTTLRALGAPNK